MKSKELRGGARKGAGRKPTNPRTHRRRLTATVAPDVYAAVLARRDGEEPLSAVVERLLRAGLSDEKNTPPAE